MSASLERVPDICIKNNMKNFVYILLCAAAALAVSCSGTVDESVRPELTADNVEIALVQDACVNFAVTYNGADVTAQSEIFTTDETLVLENAVFMPEKAGEYVFVARYNDMLSDTLAVTVTGGNTPPADETIESKYVKKVFVSEFTGAWCINCPAGFVRLMGVLSLPAMRAVKDHVHVAAFHSDVMGTDDMAIDATEDILALFGGIDFPGYATDLRDSGLLTSEGISGFRASLDASFNDYPAHCGVAVSSVLNADKTSAEVTVKVASEKTGEYRVIVLVLQNKIQGWQKTTDYPEGDNNYYHNHVVRDVVTSYVKTFAGEKITEDGKITAGDEASKTWTVAVDPEWVLENTEIYAIVQDEYGMVNNMNLCPVDGGDSDYMLK